MEKINIDTQKEFNYACCPACKHTLLQVADGTECYIKCGQCGTMIHIIAHNGNVITNREQRKI